MNHGVIGGTQANRQADARRPRHAGLLAVSLMLAITAYAFGQVDPMDGGTTTAPTSRPAMKLIIPTVDVAKHEVRLPAAFWNQKLAGWIEMAMTGMESEFLHETIVAVPTNRAILLDALHKAGFQDADAWTFSVTDFPRVRGDRAIILLEVTRDGKTETFALDELITIGGWNISAGALGWMFKGEPGGGERSLMEDPEIALQNRGLQHLANSLMDYPLSYDNWMYPLPKYLRNYRVLPAEVYDSNGSIPVTMVIRKVTEEELLRQSAAFWHDHLQAEEMLQQIPLAKEIDIRKAELLTLVPKLRKLQADSPQIALSETEEGQRAALLAAEIHNRYARLDAVQVKLAAGKVYPDFGLPKDERLDEQTIKDTKEQAAAFAAHLENEAMRTFAVMHLESANAQRREIKKRGGSEAELTQAAGSAMVFKSLEDKYASAEPLEYWTKEKARLDPTDPRTDWVRQVGLEMELATARHEKGEIGNALGTAMITGANRVDLQKVYQQVLEREQVIKMKLELANLEFEISKREGFGDDPELPAMKKQRDALAGKIAALLPATPPATLP